MNLLQRPMARLTDYLYAGWRQVRGAVSWANPRGFSGGHLAPVLVIPGVYEQWHFMLPLIRDLHEAGHPVHVIAELRDNRAPVATGARLASTYLVEHDLRDVVIVAHSKGGLIGKHVMSFGDASERVRQMAAIATPFGGSRYALMIPGRTLRAFRPGDETLALLTDALDVNARIVSVFARFDPHIPEGSELVGARNVVLETSGHFSILRHPDTRAEVLQAAALDRPD